MNKITKNRGQWHPDIKRVHHIRYRNGEYTTVVVLGDRGSGLESSVDYFDRGGVEANVNAHDCPVVRSLPARSDLLAEGWASLERGTQALAPVFVNNFGGDLSDPSGGI